MLRMILAGALTGTGLGVVENYAILANGTTQEVTRALGGAVAYAIFGAFAGAALWHVTQSSRRP
ncbi:MAG TPA: hypothetical protein VJR58_32430 [Vineibacter sp.]|nr:hypothetical protein [Vineibacter sp.]